MGRRVPGARATENGGASSLAGPAEMQDLPAARNEVRGGASGRPGRRPKGAGGQLVRVRGPQGVEGAVEAIERSAASVEEAIESALTELGISEQEARIEILQEPRQGFL